MDKISVVLSVIMMLALMVFIAPNIFALNRGKVLRNIALWLAIFAGLALVYKNFGPGSPSGAMITPDSMKNEADFPSNPDMPSKKRNGDDEAKPDSDQSFTPPKEE